MRSEHGRGDLDAGGVLVESEEARFRDRQPRAVPTGVTGIAVEQHAEFARQPSLISHSIEGVAFRLHPAGGCRTFHGATARRHRRGDRRK